MDENLDDRGETGVSSSSSSSKNKNRQPPSDHYIYVEESEEDEYCGDDVDDEKSELACPFCPEDFDVVGLCCHIDDEHPMEARTGICPVCDTKVGTNIAVHVITQHEIILKTLCNKRIRSGGSRSALSLLRKELQDKHLQSLAKGTTSTNAEPDPLLLSFICYIPQANKSMQASSSTEANLLEKRRSENTSKREVELLPLSNKDQEEKTGRCEFVHDLLFSTIFDDKL